MKIESLKGMPATKALDKKPIYGEKSIKGMRLWNPWRSKLGAAVKKGLKDVPIEEKNSVLYLGCASGTTASHVSDIVGKEGVVYCIDFAPRSLRDLILNVGNRVNMMPMLEDARTPENYPYVGIVDVVYQDIAQPDQVNIFIRNTDMFLKKGGIGFLCIKSRSVNAVKEPLKIYDESEEELKKHFKVLNRFNLEPYEMDHVLFVVKKEN